MALGKETLPFKCSKASAFRKKELTVMLLCLAEYARWCQGVRDKVGI